MEKPIQALAIKLDEPKIPQEWDYKQSVDKVSTLTYKWKDITVEVAEELWVARAVLATKPEERARATSGTFVPLDKTWSNYCKDIGSSRQVVNRWLRQYFAPQIKSREQVVLSLPEGEFNVIYADPPWRYEFSKDDADKIEAHYPTMPVEEISALKIPSSEDAVLFLWATAPKLREALEVMEAWGFDYRTNAVWDKEWIGMGYWFRGQHEFLLVGVRGNVSPPEPGTRVSSVYSERRTKHSKKPDYYYSLIQRMVPNGKYLELFARQRYNDEWTVWGDEANGK